LAAAAVLACGTESPQPGVVIPVGQIKSEGNGTSGGVSDGGSAGFGDAFSGGGVGEASLLDSFVGCASTSQQAKELPLDLAFMLDTSGSMNDLAAAHTSKWSAVVSAMNAFVTDPASAGIGVGLQYFPLVQAGVPSSCTSGTQCGSAGPCALGACLPLQPNGGVLGCDDVTGCPKGQSCYKIGACSGDANAPCNSFGMACAPDQNNFDLGTCVGPYTSSYCLGGDSCAAQDYSKQAVAIAPLPGAAAAVATSLAGHSPQGNTPTAAALTGVIQGARAYATAHPTDSVVAVLATDGQPDECTPTDTAGIAQIAAAGLAGSPSIKTFAIGVFTPDAVTAGTQVLDAIAAAGGTGTAFVIQASGNLEQQFQAALDTIRGASLPCQYTLPAPSSGIPNYGEVNVQYTAGTGAVTTIPYVESAARCDATAGGWYYNVDPSEGGTPSAILMCPATCTTLKADAKGRVDVVLGCQTVVR
jgi:hypothetical protein